MRQPAPLDRRPAWHPSSRAAALLVAVLAAAVYLNALRNPFIYDDYGTVLRNLSIVAPSDLTALIRYMPFRPVVNVSYAIDRMVWGFRPFGFHLTNVVLHAAAAVLLFALVRRMIRDARGRREDAAGDRDDPAETWGALTGASLFAVHPMMSEAVGYVSGRSELLCGGFMLATMLLTRAAIAPGRPSDGTTPTGAGTWVLIAGAVTSGILALLSKEVAASLPMLLLAYDWLILPGAPAEKRRRLPVFAALTILVAAGAIYRVRTLGGADAAMSESPVLALLTQLIVIWRYLRLLAIPIGQSIMHGVHVVTGVSDPLGIVALGGLLALAWFAVRLRRASPVVTWGILWFVLALAPSSSVVVLREPMAEHRVYVASAGLFAAVGWVAFALSRSTSAGSPRWFAGAVTAVVLTLSALTIARNAVWRSPVNVWREALAHAPDKWEPHYALGDALREAGACAAAIPEYEAVLRARDTHRDARTNLGICLAETGRLTDAEAAFEAVIRADPTFARAYTNLAGVAVLQGKPDVARDRYLRAIEVDPRNVNARMQLARLYENTYRDYQSAARICGEVLALVPTTAGARDCVDRNRARLESAR
jgi:hypothetical protein